MFKSKQILERENNTMIRLRELGRKTLRYNLRKRELEKNSWKIHEVRIECSGNLKYNIREAREQEKEELKGERGKEEPFNGLGESESEKKTS